MLARFDQLARACSLEREGSGIDVSVFMLDPRPRSGQAPPGSLATGAGALAGEVRHTRTIPGSPPISLSVWHVDPSCATGPAFELLSTDERDRAAQFRRPSDRDRYSIAHAMLRSALAARLGVGVDRIGFEPGRRGKPKLSSPRVDLHFNLSYGGAVVVLAVSAQPVGVDVEAYREDLDVEGIAARFFSLDEQAYLRRSSHGIDVTRFFDIWTRKEAAAKASGVGLEGFSSICTVQECAVFVDEQGSTTRFETRAATPDPALPGHALAIAYPVGPA